ncbi:unnamed protein product [Heligmosomoides polygyrus]|uniref:SCP domain-containing protein n=1 Tax=Heligmosomoides polygyrus TaxID=6339 RepID=A0A183F8C3_HELPZ|nr:unnamed protein product [Heligmosomoides polygyrus]
MASRFLTLTVLFLYAGILHNAFSCLPFSSFSPAFAGEFLQWTYTEAVYILKLQRNYDYAPRVGPYRSEAQSSHTSFSQEHSHRHGFEVMREEPRINTVSSLNCGTFAEKCGWANTNDEEMDWTTVQALPDAERYLSTLATENYPGMRSVTDSRAGALTSSARPGWEGGGAIFLQDIVVEGALNCNGETSSHPVLVAADPFRQELGGEGLKQSAVYSKSWAPLGPLKV